MKKKYVTVLKWKQGEHWAIKGLNETSKDFLMPLIEIPPREYDYKNQKYKKTIDQHLADMIPNIEKYFS